MCTDSVYIVGTHSTFMMLVFPFPGCTYPQSLVGTHTVMTFMTFQIFISINYSENIHKLFQLQIYFCFFHLAKLVRRLFLFKSIISEWSKRFTHELNFQSTSSLLMLKYFYFWAFLFWLKSMFANCQIKISFRFFLLSNVSFLPNFRSDLPAFVKTDSSGFFSS